MTIWGVGVDVVDLSRFEASLKRTPGLRARLFTDQEAVLSPESLAARFAAKEALVKALKAPDGLPWQDIEVVTDPDGVPSFVLRGAAEARAQEVGITAAHLSLSHETSVAIAFVVAQC